MRQLQRTRGTRNAYVSCLLIYALDLLPIQPNVQAWILELDVVIRVGLFAFFPQSNYVCVFMFIALTVIYVMNLLYYFHTEYMLYLLANFFAKYYVNVHQLINYNIESTRN